jgi:DNA-binding MarR family transcriptional regulator
MTEADDAGRDDASPDDAAREAWRAMGALVLDNERRREVSERVGLSFGKTRALRRIARKPMSMKELAGMLGVDPPNLTPVVDELERLALVERQAHPSDRRVKLVVATAAGAALAHEAEAILGRPPAGLSGLDPDELETLVEILAKVRGERGSGLGPGQ